MKTNLYSKCHAPLIALYLLASSIPLFADLNDALVAHYPLNGNANDASGFGHNGVISGGVTACPDRDGNSAGALQFDGIDGMVLVNPFSDFPATEMTVSFWMKAGAEGPAHPNPISYTTSDYDNAFAITRYNGFRIDIVNLTWGLDTGVEAFDNSWHHVAVAWNSAGGSLAVYKDGNLAYTANDIQSGRSIPSGGALVLGREQDCVADCFEAHQNYQGILDEVRIYNRALSPAEVAALHSSPSSCAPSAEFGILTEQRYGGEYGFDFDGRFIVWRDRRASEEIYAYDLLLKQEIKVSDGPAGGKYACRVSGGLVVWLRIINGYHCEIWGKDLTGRVWPSDAPPRMIKDVNGASDIDLDGDWLASSENHFGGNTADLYALNLRTGGSFPIPGPATEWHMVVSGDVVFYNSTPSIWDWMGPMDWDVWGFRLDSPTAAPFPVKVGPGNYQVLSADGDYIVLEEVPSYSIPPLRNLWLHNVITGEETLLATGANPNGAVSGSRVVYRDDSGQVTSYDISSGQRCPVSAGPAGDLKFAVDTAVWNDFRPPSTGGWFIYGCTFTDRIPPVIHCPADIITTTDPGQCSAVVTYTVIAEDNQPGVTVVCMPPSGATIPKGSTAITCTATDAAGNTAACSFTVTVVDQEAPTLSCPADIALPCSIDLLVPVTFSVSAQDNCDAQPSVTCNPPSGSGFPIGVTTVTCTATDEAGNASTCSFKVTRAPLGFTGFLQPLGGADDTGGSYAAPLRTLKLGSTIPVKFTASCGGTPIITGVHRLQLMKFSDATTSEEPIDASPQDAATTGNEFRLTDGQWHFNLDTKATGMTKGIWQVVATLSDGSQHRAWIQVK